MKNLFKVENILRMFGIIALIAIIGFSFAACNMDGSDDDDNNNNNQQTQEPDLTFTLSDGTAGDNKYEVTVSGTEWDAEKVADGIGGIDDTKGLALFLSANDVYTLSADKKTVVVAIYDNPGVDGNNDNLRSDATPIFKFSTQDGTRENLAYCTIAQGSGIYTGQITLIEPPEGVSVTIKNNDYKPE